MKKELEREHTPEAHQCLEQVPQKEIHPSWHTPVNRSETLLTKNKKCYGYNVQIQKLLKQNNEAD